MTGCKPANTPIEGGLKLCVEEDQTPTDKGQFQRLVGKLMYLSHTRPDLAYALSTVSQFMHNPGKQHMDAVTHILRYIKAAPGKGILFRKNSTEQEIQVYTDADWAGDIGDRKSTSGYFTFVEGNLVTWRSKKQNVVARSSAEAELRGVVLGLCEGLWINLLLGDLGFASAFLEIFLGICILLVQLAVYF
ncbi:secreted RxLR effector protein 161-like [Jatropha curcas]|uniref:secreted RxLR effector protein 161-like n=1 Tax=Jatropha curcas TaxID=180498 RepID=UPI0018945580|nr:secreted RxLR effector protein 161-like [Jatropha curcas]